MICPLRCPVFSPFSKNGWVISSRLYYPSTRRRSNFRKGNKVCGYLNSGSGSCVSPPLFFTDLEATLNCLESVLSHYDVSQEVCQLIHQGPIEGNISVFLDALAKLRAAMDYFLHNNSQSVELENVTSLFNTGCEGLNQHYSMLLKKHSAPLKPVELLDLIYIEDDSSDEYTSFRQLSQTTREELYTISHWLEQNLREYTHIYATERGDVVLRSLQLLKDHQKSNSWGHEALVSFFDIL